MSDFDELRRGNYHADGARKATQQEMEELSRASFHPDAVAKAAEQEAFDAAVERAEAAEPSVYGRQTSRESAQAAAQRRSSGPREAPARDLADHTVMRRPSRTATDTSGPLGGGAVISKKSALGAAMHRRARRDAAVGGGPRQSKREERRQRRAWRRAERRARRERDGGGGLRSFIVFVVALITLYLVVCGPIDRAISFTRQEREGLSQELSWHVPGMPYYVLALGSDAREEGEASRTDTMILVRVDPLAGKLTMLSIPRDTKVEIEGQGTQKINAAYTFGGLAGAVREVHELTGAPVSQVAMVKFDGIESLVDYLGGVSVNVPVAVNDPAYTGLSLPAGEQVMDGHTALLYSRVRHGFDLGDYQRQKDQRILIEAIMDKALSLPPTQMPGLVKNMGSMMNTTMRMYSIIPLMLRLKLGGTTIYQATVPSSSAMENGVSYEVTDMAALSEMMALIDAGGDPATLM